MGDREARRHALSEWFIEVSVLWAVFPVLDQLIEGGSILTRLTILAFVISATTLISGILIRKGQP